jgi:hypothetical protein
MKHQSWEVTKAKELGMLCFVVATFAPPGHEQEGQARLYRGSVPHNIVIKLNSDELEPVLAYYLERMDLEPIIGFNNEMLWFATNEPTNQHANNNTAFDQFWTIAEDIPIDSTNNLSQWTEAYTDFEAE